MRECEERQSVERREDYGYERVSVVVQSSARYGDVGYDITNSVTGDVLCVVNEELEGVR